MQHVFLIDTVGFVSQLPNALLDGFQATFEEAVHASLLVHVIDSSAHNARHQRDVVVRHLKNIGEWRAVNEGESQVGNLAENWLGCTDWIKRTTARFAICTDVRIGPFCTTPRFPTRAIV